MRVVTDREIVSVLGAMNEFRDKNLFLMAKLRTARGLISAGQPLSATDALTVSSILESYL